MNKIALISSLIIAGLVFLVLGVGLGIFYQTQQAGLQLKKATAVIKSLSSKNIPSIVAYGQVTKIEGRDITLFYGGDSIKINIEENSPVYSFINNSKEKVEFNKIKIGDNLSITIRLLSDGQIKGQQIFILLPFGTPINTN